MNMYHIELTKPNGSNIKTNIPARDVVELQKIVEKDHKGYKIKKYFTSEEMEAIRKKLEVVK